MKTTKTATMPAVPSGPATTPAYSLSCAHGDASGGTTVTGTGGVRALAPATVAIGRVVASGTVDWGSTWDPPRGGGSTCKACVVATAEPSAPVGCVEDCVVAGFRAISWFTSATVSFTLAMTPPDLFGCGSHCALALMLSLYTGSCSASA